MSYDKSDHQFCGSVYKLSDLTKYFLSLQFFNSSYASFFPSSAQHENWGPQFPWLAEACTLLVGLSGFRLFMDDGSSLDLTLF